MSDVSNMDNGCNESAFPLFSSLSLCGKRKCAVALSIAMAIPISISITNGKNLEP
jgi:hypothetical protein